MASALESRSNMPRKPAADRRDMADPPGAMIGKQTCEVSRDDTAPCRLKHLTLLPGRQLTLLSTKQIMIIVD